MLINFDLLKIRWLLDSLYVKLSKGRLPEWHGRDDIILYDVPIKERCHVSLESMSIIQQKIQK